jgi:hypothetical protein
MLQVGGFLQVPPGFLPAAVNGHRTDGLVSVWFLGAPNDRRSAFSLAGAIIRRAALFRPGFVGAWMYVVLVLVVIPATLLAAVRLMALVGVSRPRALSTPLVIFALAFINAGSWALITPAFQTPDEPEHFAYAEYLAQTGHPPARTLGPRGPYSSREALAIGAVHAYGVAEASSARPPWAHELPRRWHRLAYHAAGDDGGGYLVSAAPNSPLYYSTLIPAYRAGGVDPFAELTAMRFVSALFGALTALCAFLTVREILPRWPLAAVSAGLIVAFQPMFGFISGAVSNDNGVNAAAASVVFLLIRGLRRGITPLVGVGLGISLVALPLMKGTGFALYPAAGVGILGMAWRQHDHKAIRGWLALAATLVMAVLVWHLFSTAPTRATHGGGTGASGATLTSGTIKNTLHHPTLYLSYLWQVFLPRLPFMTDLASQPWPAFDIYVKRGWGAFGWYAIEFPHWVYLIVVTVMIAVGALAVRTVYRERRIARSLWIELVVLSLVIIGVIGGVEAAYTGTAPRPVVAEQGRYAFTAIVPLATVAVAGCFGAGRSRAIWLLAALASAVLGMSYAAQLLTLVRFFS